MLCLAPPEPAPVATRQTAAVVCSSAAFPSRYAAVHPQRRMHPAVATSQIVSPGKHTTPPLSPAGLLSVRRLPAAVPPTSDAALQSPQPPSPRREPQLHFPDPPN